MLDLLKTIYTMSFSPREAPVKIITLADDDILWPVDIRGTACSLIDLDLRSGKPCETRPVSLLLDFTIVLPGLNGYIHLLTLTVKTVLTSELPPNMYRLNQTLTLAWVIASTAW